MRSEHKSNGDEWDAFTAARHMLVSMRRAGVRKKLKKRSHRIDRHAATPGSAAQGKRRVNHHSYSVQWSAEDDEYVALAAEFPSLSWLDKDPVRALAGLVRLVDDVRKDITRPNPDSLTRTSRSRLERYAINGKLNVQGRRGRQPKTQKDCQNPE